MIAKSLRCGACGQVFDTPAMIADAWSRDKVSLTVRCPRCANPGIYGSDGRAQPRTFRDRQQR
jgi:DNA-directed RNA polymerase subunit RPC12/RpoP